MSISRTGSGMYVSSASSSASIWSIHFWSPSIALASPTPRMTGTLSPSEVVLREQLTDFELDEIEKLGIVDEIALVQEHHDTRHVDLACQQDVLARLRHRTVDCAHDQDRAVHLRGTRDHVLHVVCVSRAVDVRVVAVLRLVLDMRRRDRKNFRRVAAPLRRRRFRDFVIGDVFGSIALVRRHLGKSQP